MRSEFTAKNDAGAAAEFISVTNENHDQCVTSRSRSFSRTSPSTPSRRSDFECCGGVLSTRKTPGAWKGGEKRPPPPFRPRGGWLAPPRTRGAGGGGFGGGRGAGGAASPPKANPARP